MKTRITALFLAIAILVLLLSGCGAIEVETETTVAATEESSIMVPKVAYLNFLEESDNPAWQFVWNFHWNEEGYLTEIEGEKRVNGDTARLSKYYIEKDDGWYETLDFFPYPVELYMDDCVFGPYNAFPGEVPISSWQGRGTYGMGHIPICTMITAGVRDGQNQERIYNEYVREGGQGNDDWLYADFTYDDLGNAVRIDTYNLAEVLCSYIEIEWVTLDQIQEADDISLESDTISIMVPRIARLNFLEENGGPAWQFIWHFKWNERGYLTVLEAEHIVKGEKYQGAHYFVKEQDGWYNTGGILYGSFDEIYSKYASGPYPHMPGEYTVTGYAEGGSELGHNRTQICATITAGTRDYLSPKRIYNDIPSDYSYGERDLRLWLYADFTYDEHGNAVRIDTYNLEGELSGYTEIEWMTIDIIP